MVDAPDWLGHAVPMATNASVIAIRAKPSSLPLFMRSTFPSQGRLAYQLARVARRRFDSSATRPARQPTGSPKYCSPSATVPKAGLPRVEAAAANRLAWPEEP